MQRSSPYENALIEQMKIVVSIKSVNAKILAQESGVSVDRIYRIRKGAAGDLTWPEVHAMQAAIKKMANHAA